MEVMIFLLFIGFFFVSSFIWLFFWTMRKGSLQHADRLALLPLSQDDTISRSTGSEDQKGKS